MCLRHAFLLSVPPLLLTFVMVPAAWAQETVQLPTFNYTTVATTVLVPDQGQAYLGGVLRAQDGRSQLGVPLLSGLPGIGRPFGNSGIGQTRSASGMSVTAQIHDFEAMDKALLAQAAAQHGNSLAGSGVQLPGQPTASAMSVADAQQSRADEAAQARLDVGNFLAKAQAAEADGRPNVAKIYYRVVARDTHDPAVRATAQEHLAALSGRNASKLAAAAQPAAR